MHESYLLAHKKKASFGSTSKEFNTLFIVLSFKFSKNVFLFYFWKNQGKVWRFFSVSIMNHISLFPDELCRTFAVLSSG